MISITELKKLSKEKLKDSEILLNNNRFEGAVYLCGYAIELALKARICKTLKLKEYPEGDNYKSFRTHNLRVLLHLSGIEVKIFENYLIDWNKVIKWNPEMRYDSKLNYSKNQVSDIIKSTKILLRII